ncbi:hypothetical protein ACWOEJ_07720 [Enterococcus eurekensis]|uniref:Asparagine synthetase domain-containing protein n=1 Tax=Enterococcus eurekensis TaxID=1159753 RepID=A0ABV9M4W0_9ENTE
MHTKKEIEEILDVYPKYRETLFIRGYLITDKNIDFDDTYPFYNNWNKINFGTLTNGNQLSIYYHKAQDFYRYSEQDIEIAIIGHAYNPFDFVHDENQILRDLVSQYKISKEQFFDKVNELTGIHLIVVNYKGLIFGVQDCSGMKSCYFGRVEDKIWITSHPQLVGDLCDLTMDLFVNKLVHSKPYNIGNKHLPGNMSPYKELKRLGGNTYFNYDNNFKIIRFYPVQPHAEISNQNEFDDGINKIGKIMHNNISLAALKWDKPAISLTGGTDSKTTLACANGLYDKYKYFSFHCKEPEIIDAKAAGLICEELNLKHDVYPIPDKNEDVEDFEVLKKIINHNSSYFKNTADHEIRKMITLYRLNDFDIELKSWASETARVFLERKYEVDMPVKLTERHFSIFQTRYFLTPNLLRKSDEVYKEFMNEIGLTGPLFNFEHTDLFYWEVRMGAWGTSVTSSLDFCHNVTMPINNRKLLELFLSFPHDDRKTDRVHKNVIKLYNKNIHDMDVEIKNLYFHSHRIWIEKIYYYYRTLFYKGANKKRS